MFRRLLIAEADESAAQIARAAQALGVDTVISQSGVDCSSGFEGVIAAARNAGADAVFPGHGDVRTTLALAGAAEAAGLAFIGPSSQTIRAMGQTEALKPVFGELMDRMPLSGPRRRVAVPVLGDGTTTLHLPTQDCSLVHGDRVVLAEAPAPGLMA